MKTSTTRISTPRRWPQALSALALSALAPSHLGCTTKPAQPSAVPSSALLGSRAYDFNLGCWKIANRKLKQLFQNSKTWDTFETTQTGGLLLGGLVGYDEIHDAQGAPVGMSFHLYDRRTQRFSSSWVSVRDGVLQPPVVGGFSGDGGVFEGSDVLAERPIRVRYIWSRITTSNPRWEQAFSADAGRSWETNWVMDYTRMACANDASNG